MSQFKMSPFILIAMSAATILASCQTVRQINPRDTLDAFVAPFNVVKGVGDLFSRFDIPYFDQNDDGVLDASEFSDAMMEKGRYRFRAAEADMTTERYIAADFKAIDQSGDGFISQDEYAAYRDWHYNETRRRFVEGEI